MTDLTMSSHLSSHSEADSLSPDGPNYTPRISGVMHIKNGVFDYSMSILKSNNGQPLLQITDTHFIREPCSR